MVVAKALVAPQILCSDLYKLRLHIFAQIEIMVKLRGLVQNFKLKRIRDTSKSHPLAPLTTYTYLVIKNRSLAIYVYA